MDRTASERLQVGRATAQNCTPQKGRRGLRKTLTRQNSTPRKGKRALTRGANPPVNWGVEPRQRALAATLDPLDPLALVARPWAFCDGAPLPKQTR